MVCVFLCVNEEKREREKEKEREEKRREEKIERQGREVKNKSFFNNNY